MKTISLFAGLVLLAVACLQIVEGYQMAFVLADRPLLASYTPNQNYAYNAGKPVTILRNSVGNYKVRFGRVAKHGAHSQVTMFGTRAGHCAIYGWGRGDVSVRCFDVNGAHADRKFTLLSIKACGDDRELVTYAFLNRESENFYVTSSNYRFGDGPFEVERFGAGRYLLNVDFTNERTVMLVSTFGSNRICYNWAWNGDYATVECVDNSLNYSDSRSTMLAINTRFPHASILFSYSGKMVTPQWSFSSDGSDQEVTKTAVGNYEVTIGPEANVGGHVQVAAESSHSNHSKATCGILGWGGGKVRIRCTQGGVPTDTGFSLVAFN